MKIKTLFFCLATFISGLNTNAQWIQQNSGTTNNLYDVHFPTQDTGYVVGYYGTILKTIDGGTNWNSLNSGTTVNLNSVHFVTNQKGFAVGDSGLILKTINGGITWNIDTINLNYQFNEIYFINSSIGFIVGKKTAPNPIILKTTNSGANWNNAIIIDSNSISSGYGITNIHFPTTDTGYAVFRSGVIKSIDGGDNWSIITSSQNPADSVFPFSILESCYFTDANTGYIAGWYNPALWKTSDGGNYWTDLDTSTADLTFTLYDIYFPTNNTGYASGWYGLIFKTTDAGNNWQIQSVPIPSYSLYSVYFTDENNGFAVGESGTIIKTTNGGGITRVNDINLKLQKITVYPNPFSAYTLIEFENYKKEKHTLTLYNSLGQLVRQIDNINEGQVKIEKKNLTSGLYFFQLRNEIEIVGMGKIIIK